MTTELPVAINLKRIYGNVIFLLFVSLMMLCSLTSASDELQRPQNDEEQTTISFYGRLSLHPSFVNHPEFNNPLWHVQGGEVMLTSAQHTVRMPTQMDGSFVVHDLPYGVYHLHAEYADFIYPTVRVDVTQRTSQGVVKPVVRTYTNDGVMTPLRGTGLDESSPAIIPISDVYHYYVPREQYSVVAFIKNPMIIMMLLSMGMIGLMQLLPEEDRKESARELQRLQKQLSGGNSDRNREPSLQALKGEKKSR